MSLSAAVPSKFESASRILATAKPSVGKFGAIGFDRPGKSGQGIRMSAAPSTPIVHGGDAAPANYTMSKMTLKMGVSIRAY